MGRRSGGRGDFSRLIPEEISALRCPAKPPGPRALATADEKLGVGKEAKPIATKLDLL